MISMLEHNGELIRTRELYLNEVLLLGARYLLEDIKDMVRR